MDNQQIAVRRLPELAKLINRAQKGLEGGAADVLRNARAMGDFLREAKSYVAHGEWTHWVEEHCSVQLRQAGKYMQLAEKWDEIEAKWPSGQICELGINDALASVAQKRDVTPDNGEVHAKAKKPKKRDTGPIRGELIDLDAEPREGFDGYNTDINETPRVFVQEFRDLWEEADESGKLAIALFAVELPEFKQHTSVAAVMEHRRRPKKRATKKPAKKAKKRTRKKAAKK